MSWTPGGYFYSGKQGEAGPIGPEGPTGPKGPIGPQGPAGSITDFSNIILAGTNMTNKLLVSNSNGTGIFQVDTVNNALLSAGYTLIIPSIDGNAFNVGTRQHGGTNVFSVNTLGGITNLSNLFIEPALTNTTAINVYTQGGGKQIMSLNTVPALLSLNADLTLTGSIQQTSSSSFNSFHSLSYFSDIIPLNNNTNNIGSSSSYFANGYFNHLNGVIYNPSDEKLKKNIRECDHGLDFIKTLNPISWEWNETSNYTGTSHGLSYQSLTGTSMVRDADNDNDCGRVCYIQLIAPLIKSVKQLSAENEELKARIAEIESIDYSDLIKSMNDRLSNLEMKGTRKK